MYSKTHFLLAFFLILSFFPTPALVAQEGHKNMNSVDSGNLTHELPFASTENILELDIINTTDRILENLTFQIDFPKWILLKDGPVILPTLEPGQKATIQIVFDVDDRAPIQETSNLSILVSNNGETAWNKSISLLVNPPDQFELLQNYPNPFNPTTNIKYLLPESMHVNVSVYDLTGRLVARLLNSQQEPGSHKIQWNAASFASGVYFYRIVAETPNGNNIIQNKKMLLIK